MRSSVSYILSSTTSEPNMSHPDYEQYSHDHAALLVLVKQVGSLLKPKTFNKCYERIARVNSVKITDSTGQVRGVSVRYVRDHPIENNDWGDFQTHRRLLGLISIGKYDAQRELNEICRVHESLKVKYTNTLFDTRCILFGVGGEETGSVENKEKDDGDGTETSSDADSSLSDLQPTKFTTPSNFKTRALFYDESADSSADLETQLTEFINSLFWVLESKRLERSREKIERVTLLLAPFEKKDFVGLDMDSRNSKKRCTGRMTKHLGDFCLQAGLVSESLGYYHSAAEMLKSVNDWLWLGAAYEGLCAASALVLYPNMQRNVPLHRNASLQETSPKRSNSISSAPGLETSTKDIISNALTPEEIAKRYREAIIHYSKYQNAGIVETEASFKAARISVEQNHSLQAASFLQNVIYINLTLSEQEKIQRFEILSDLYLQIGFARKAAFCQRLAATRYVSPQNTTPNWNQCYSLILQSFPGQKIALDPVEMCTEIVQGWPVLQIQLLQELVVAAKRMCHSALATRHMTYLLQTMWQHLSPSDRREFAIQLQSLSAQCEGAPVPLVLDSGVVIPPANLTNVPICTKFTLRNLKPHVQPQKIVKVKQDCGPFLFTPINFGSLERRSNKPQNKRDFLWVENDPCEVMLKLTNPLPFELKVSNMRLLTSGVVFESLPETVPLAPDVPTTVILHGTPKESGELQVLGYSTHTLGVKSNCRLRHMRSFLPMYSIDVVPPLPSMDIKTSLPQTATFPSFQNVENVVTSASLSLYNGESSECTLTLTNTGQIAIDMIEMMLQSHLIEADQVFKWSEDELNSQLPILPGVSAAITVKICHAHNFLVKGATAADFSSGSWQVGSTMSASVGPSSLPSRLSSPVHVGGMSSSLYGRMNSSVRSSNSGHSSFTNAATLTLPHHTASTLVEASVQFKYSGGKGMAEGYCRISSVFISLEILPSLQVTNWDVLPAETSSQFYLVLDIGNLTSQEMELNYAPTKYMLVEAHESCRIPVPVERCPLSKLTQAQLDKKETAPADHFELDKVCSEHVADRVELWWRLPSVDMRGHATLRGISLNAAMLDIVRMSPLNWEVCINGNAVKPQEDVACLAGDSLPISVVISNRLDRSLRQLTLSVQFYQDHENGVHNYRVETRVIIIGTSKTLVPLLEPENKTSHSCNVLFLTPGKYKMDIQCCAPENLCMPSNFESAGHVWRYIPPVEVNVNM